MSAPSPRAVTSAGAACAAAQNTQQPIEGPSTLKALTALKALAVLRVLKALRALIIGISRSGRRSWRLEYGCLELLLQSLPHSGTHRTEHALKIRWNMFDCTALRLEHVGVEHGLPINPFRRGQILHRQQCRQKAVVRICEPLSL